MKEADSILTGDFHTQKKRISVIPDVGMDLILLEYSYFHACCSHYFEYNFYKFANTVFKIKYKSLYPCRHIALTFVTNFIFLISK